MDSIAAFAFGIDVDSMNNPDHPIVINGKNTVSTDANFSRIISVLAPNIARYFRLEFFDKKMLDYFGNLVNESLNSNELPSQDKPSFLQMMADLVKINKHQALFPKSKAKIWINVI